MQTFLPYNSFPQSAYCLDSQRLWKQCVEVKQLLLNQYPNHPASKMWRGYESALALYGTTCCNEALERGIKAGNVKDFVKHLLALKVSHHLG